MSFMKDLQGGQKTSRFSGRFFYERNDATEKELSELDSSPKGQAPAKDDKNSWINVMLSECKHFLQIDERNIHALDSSPKGQAPAQNDVKHQMIRSSFYVGKFLGDFSIRNTEEINTTQVPRLAIFDLGVNPTDHAAVIERNDLFGLK